MQIEVYKDDSSITETPIDTYESNRVPEIGERLQAADFEHWKVTEIVNAADIDGDVAVFVTADI